MSFSIARIEEKSPGQFQILETRKARLGGPEGPIAKHVLAQAQPDWSLEGPALARSLAPEEWADATLWLIWQAPEEPPYRVSHIPGVSSEFSTDLMVQLELLEAGPDNTYRPLGKLTGEALSLSGGRITPKAKWTWTAPKMSIGSTTLG